MSVFPAFVSLPFRVRFSLFRSLPALSLAFVGLLSFLAAPAAWAVAVATTTTISVSPTNGPVGTVVTVTATVTVTSSGAAVTAGQVRFCDYYGSTSCTDAHYYGTAQLNSSGKATLKLKPTAQEVDFIAKFQPTTSYLASASSLADSYLTFNPLQTTTSVLTATGSAGNYTLTNTLTGSGSLKQFNLQTSFVDASNSNYSLGTVTPTLTASANMVISATATTGSAPSAVAAADFNNDGSQDIVAASADGNVTLLINNGSGTFTSTALTAGGAPDSIAVGDFNSDGNMDFAVLNKTGNSITLFLGDGTGAFTKSTLTPTGLSSGLTLVAGDFNNDGQADLAVLNSNNTVLVLLGSGTGTFPTTKSTTFTGSTPAHFATSDFNGDGHADLIVANSAGSLSLLLGVGDGTFTAGTTPPTATNDTFVVVLDYSNSGYHSLAVLNPTANTVSLLLASSTGGVANGTFTYQSAIALPAGSGATSMVATNFTGATSYAAYTDILVVQGSKGTVTVLPSTYGSFGAALGPFTVGANPTAVVAADFTGDGIPDIATANTGGNTVTVLADTPTHVATAVLNGVNPAGNTVHNISTTYIGDSYSYAASTSNTVGLTAQAIATTVDIAGTPESAVSGQSVTLEARPQPVQNHIATGTVTFYNGSTALSTVSVVNGAASYNTSTLPAATNSIKAVYNGDIYIAASTSAVTAYLVTATASTTTLAVTSGATPVTTAVSGTTITLTATVKSGATVITPGVVNFCDSAAAFCTGSHLLGTAELTTAGTASIKIRPLIGAHSYKAVFVATRAYPGSASAASALTVTAAAPFATTTAFTTTGSAGNYTFQATVSGAGAIQPSPTGAVSFVDTSNSNAVLGTAATGSPVLATSLSTNSSTTLSVSATLFGDFNGDGIQDAISLAYPSGITVLLGKGDGTFTTGSTYAANYAYGGVVGDFNGDGKLDFAVYTGYSTVLVYLGNGDGTFTLKTTMNTYAYSLAALDLNGDGKLDLVLSTSSAVTNMPGYVLQSYAGNGDGTFALVSTSAVFASSPPQYLAAGDFNGDGILDLAGAMGSSVAVFLGNGDGSLTLTSTYPLTSLQTLVAADLNGDGRTDLVAANSGALNVFLANSDGTLHAPTSVSGSYSSVYSASLGDINGDGIPDLVYYSYSSGVSAYQVTFAPGNGDGTFGTPVGQTVATGLQVSHVYAVDLNADGLADVYTDYNSYGSAVVSPVYLTTVSHTSTATLAGASAPGSGTHQVAAQYSGDTNYAASTSSTVPVTAVYFSLTATPTTAAYGSIVTLKAALASTTATGTVTFYSNSTRLGTGTLSNGVATLTSTGLPVGQDTVVAVYSGDGSNAAATSNGVVIFINVPTTAVGSTSTSSQTIFYFTSSVTLNSTLAKAVQVVTQGLTGLDFNYASGGTCAAGVTYTSGQSCSVNFTFSPTAPGVRTGAVVLFNNSATPLPLATNYITGTGTGPLAVLTPGTISTIAGTGTTNYSPAQEGQPAANATLNGPLGAVADAAGNIYVSDTNSQRVRKISAASGTITTVAGNGGGGYSAAQDGGLATSAYLYSPAGLALDGAGNLYIADRSNNRIRKVTPSGIITTIAGNGSTSYVAAQDGGPATSATLYSPFGVAVDAFGNVFISDTANNRIRQVTPAGIITTVAGNGGTTFASSQDGGLATAATLYSPQGIALDNAGNLYIADTNDERIRKVVLATGIITTAAGNGSSGYAAAQEGGPATSATVYTPTGLAADGAGNIYVTELYNNRTRKVTVATGLITTVAGNGAFGYSAAQDGGPATSAQTEYPQGIAVDGLGNLYLVDTSNQRLRKVTASAVPLAFGSVAVGATSATQSVTVTNNGDTNLAFSGLATSNSSFALSGSTCTSTGTLTTGATCTIGVTFTPQVAAPTTGTAVATDNALNIAGSTQSIVLSGTGTAGTKTLTFPQPPSQPAGTSYTLTATASNADPVTYAIATGGTGTASLSGNVITYLTAGTVNITASSAATANASAAADVTDTVTITASATTFTAPTTAVGATSTTQTAEITFTTAGTPSYFSVNALGSIYADYTMVNGGTCSTATTYSVGQSCTVLYTFNPVTPGLRPGGAVAATGSAVLGQSFISGVGTGPLAQYTVPTSTTYATISSGTAGDAAFDGNGNLYVETAASFYRVPAGGGTPQVIGSQTSGGRGVVVDGVGNVFYAPGNVLYEIPVGSSSTGTQVATLTSADNSLIADAAGNIYYINETSSTGIITKLAAGTFASSVVATVGTRVIGFTIDSAGNIFAAGFGNGTIYRIAAGTSTATAVATGLSSPYGIALDAAGNLFLSNYGNGVITRLQAGTYTATNIYSSGLSASFLKFDPAGNLYYGSSAGNVYVLKRGTGTPLSFGPTTVGATSAPQSLVFENDGNAALSITSIATNFPSNFTFAGATAGSNAACGASLAAAGTCGLAITFTPQAAATTIATGTITDNSLNTTSTQTVALTGNSLNAQPTITSISPATGDAAGGTTVTITGTNLTGIISVKFGATSATSRTLISNTSLTAVAPAGTGTVHITVSNSNFTSATSTADQFTYFLGQAIAFTQPATPVFVNATATLSATGGASGNPVTFSILSGPATLSGANNSTITYTGAGTVVIAANQAGNATYLAAPQATETVTVLSQSVFIINSGGNVTTKYDNGNAQSTSIAGGGIGAATDATGYVWSINTNGNGVTKFTDLGAFSVSYSGAGVAAATALAIDGNGVVWITNNAGTISALTNAGAAVSTTPVGAAGNISTPSSIAVNAAGSLWIANPGNNTVTEVIGIAAPVTTPTVQQVINSNPGTKP